jgi:4-hydroxybutyrate dehydrogenase
VALINLVTRVQFDFGAIKLLEAEIGMIGLRRPLVVTDKGVIAAGLWDRVKAQLPGNMPLAVYDGTPPNPTESAMRDALALYRAQGCDGLIAIGGGSPMDLAKAVALMATHEGNSLFDYAVVSGGGPRITKACAPIVAIPTTAGTGSEVSRGGIIIMDNGRKLAIGSPFLLPRVSICDPELTLGLPRQLTAGTGMDAIAHCIEAYCVNVANPPTDAIVLDGLDKAWRHLERAVSDGADREARWNMMMAAMEGAIGFQKGLGAVHALSHPTGGLAGHSLHHGTLNAIYLPGVIRFNAPVLGEKIARMAETLGLPERERNAEGLAEAIAAMNARIGLPAGLRTMGVREDELDTIADGATKDHCHAANPRTATKEEYRQIAEAAWV